MVFGQRQVAGAAATETLPPHMGLKGEVYGQLTDAPRATRRQSKSTAPTCLAASAWASTSESPSVTKPWASTADISCCERIVAIPEAAKLRTPPAHEPIPSMAERAPRGSSSSAVPWTEASAASAAATTGCLCSASTVTRYAELGTMAIVAPSATAAELASTRFVDVGGWPRAAGFNVASSAFADAAAREAVGKVARLDDEGPPCAGTAGRKQLSVSSTSDPSWVRVRVKAGWQRLR